jgi:hypothetical protein
MTVKILQNVKEFGEVGIMQEKQGFTRYLHRRSFSIRIFLSHGAELVKI